MTADEELARSIVQPLGEEFYPPGSFRAGSIVDEGMRNRALTELNVSGTKLLGYLADKGLIDLEAIKAGLEE